MQRHTRGFGCILRFLIAALALMGCKPAPDPDTTPPAEVDNLTIVAGNQQVVFTWTDPADRDFSKVEIWNKTSIPDYLELTVRPGIQTAMLYGLTNGREWRFNVRTVDTTGNTSAGQTVTTIPAPPLSAAYGCCALRNNSIPYEPRVIPSVF